MAAGRGGTVEGSLGQKACADAMCNAATIEALTRAVESGGWEPITT